MIELLYIYKYIYCYTHTKVPKKPHENHNTIDHIKGFKGTTQHYRIEEFQRVPQTGPRYTERRASPHRQLMEVLPVRARRRIKTNCQMHMQLTPPIYMYINDMLCIRYVSYFLVDFRTIHSY